MTIDAPDAFTNLLQIFDEGLRRSKGGRFLGQRPVLSKQPLKYADYHVWQSWPEVDVRRRALGSALHKLFQTGALGGGDLATVGIWSKNCPSTSLSPNARCGDQTNALTRHRLAGHRPRAAGVWQGRSQLVRHAWEGLCRCVLHVFTPKYMILSRRHRIPTEFM